MGGGLEPPGPSSDRLWVQYLGLDFTVRLDKYLYILIDNRQQKNQNSIDSTFTYYLFSLKAILIRAGASAGAGCRAARRTGARRPRQVSCVDLPPRTAQERACDGWRRASRNATSALCSRALQPPRASSSNAPSHGSAPNHIEWEFRNVVIGMHKCNWRKR